VAGAGEELKLGDFGLTMSMKQELAISPVGTVEYMAPEVRVRGDTCFVTYHRVLAATAGISLISFPFVQCS
jgi:serine/threonine protein kinase